MFDSTNETESHSTGDAPARGPLSGVTVVSLEHAVAAPFATRQLADLGARVIKVERPDGGDFSRDYDHVVEGALSSTFLWSSRGKESVALDLKSAAGRGVLDQLLARADVFVHNLGPGAIDRMGFSVESLRERYPRLVIATNSGYGDAGPYANRKAYDAIVQAESGVVSNTGHPDAMAKPGFSAADVAAAMYIFAAVLTGLYQRERDGDGGACEIVMLDAITDWIGSYVYYAGHSGRNPERIALGHPSVVPYGAFRCADGTEVVIGIQNDREWRRFVAGVLDRSDLAADSRYAGNLERSRRREVVNGLIQGIVGEMSAAEVTRRLTEADVAYGKVNSLLDAFNNPAFDERGRWIRTATPVGDVRTFRPVIQSRGSRFLPSGVPDLGEHTAKVLAELGYEGADVEELLAASLADS